MLLPVPVGCAADKEPELLGFADDDAVKVEPDAVRSRRWKSPTGQFEGAHSSLAPVAAIKQVSMVQKMRHADLAVSWYDFIASATARIEMCFETTGGNDEIQFFKQVNLA